MPFLLSEESSFEYREKDQWLLEPSIIWEEKQDIYNNKSYKSF